MACFPEPVRYVKSIEVPHALEISGAECAPEPNEEDLAKR